jgi:hypothetical protein
MQTTGRKEMKIITFIYENPAHFMALIWLYTVIFFFIIISFDRGKE